MTASDIVFDCPACGKSLVVDEAAEGMIVDCPQCRTNVIVPPKPTKPAASTPPSPTAPPQKEEPRAEKKSGPVAARRDDSTLQERLAVLSGQLKEIQAQRTEVTGRIASRLNDVNRDLVIIARLETSQQQILAEWNQLMGRIAADHSFEDAELEQPAVIGSSVAAGRTRVTFGH
ncbi:MAG TPA: hypothetical protein VMP11_01625 [Verrucomicrobiae bacterium]|nr:hypothetical protein [Verrucomicrobiae bacterium]